MTLTPRQKQYLWLMGSHPSKIAVQGHGYRGKELLYGFDEDDLVIFGYSNPLMWLKNRGLVRTLANHPRGYELTPAGETQYQKLLLSGFGDKAPVREVKVAPRVLG